MKEVCRDIIWDHFALPSPSLKQGNVRNKEDQFTGSIWDCLPVTEKEKDAISFSTLNYEVKINQFPGLFTIGRYSKSCFC